jgi:hypothetical protein
MVSRCRIPSEWHQCNHRLNKSKPTKRRCSLHSEGHTPGQKSNRLSTSRNSAKQCCFLNPPAMSETLGPEESANSYCAAPFSYPKFYLSITTLFHSLTTLHATMQLSSVTSWNGAATQKDSPVVIQFRPLKSCLMCLYGPKAQREQTPRKNTSI